MPPIRMRSQQLIRLLERKKIQHQLPHLTPPSNLLVQDTRVRRRQHAIRAIRQIAQHIDDVVAEPLEAEAVAEDVQVEKRVVGWFTVFEGEGREGPGVEPGDEQLEGFD
jgi:hypothetical protein